MKMVLEMPGIDPKKRDHHGRTASHIAALCGCPNVLRAMMDYDIFDASETDAFGNTSLHLSARGQSLTAVDVLLPHFDMLKGRINRWGQTARDIAVVYGAHDIEIMLERAGLRLQAPRLPEDGPPLYIELEPYSQTPEHLALLRPQGLVRARGRSKSRRRKIPKERSREQSSSPEYQLYEKRSGYC